MHPWMERQIAPVRPGDALEIFAYLPPNPICSISR